jgi:hypothetical protein
VQVLPQFTGFTSTKVQILTQQARSTGRWSNTDTCGAARQGALLSVYWLYYYKSTSTDNCCAARQGAVLYSARREVPVLPQFTGFTSVTSTKVQILTQQALQGAVLYGARREVQVLPQHGRNDYACFTSTKVQLLTQQALQGAVLYSARGEVQVLPQHGRNDYACGRKIQDRLDPKYVLLQYVLLQYV